MSDQSQWPNMNAPVQASRLAKGEQIPSPVSGHRTILYLRRALADGDSLLDLPPRRGVAALAHHPPASKVREQLALENALACTNKVR